MRALEIFGGIHIADYAKYTSESPIQALPAPKRVVLHLSQHIGAPAKLQFKINDQIKCGQIIAEAGGFVSAPVHASISGKVIAAGFFAHPIAGRAQAVVVEQTSEADSKLPEFTREDGLSLSVDEIKNRIKASGVVGLGGAGFPTHVKYSPPPKSHVHTIILNGAECEPVLTADHRLMLEEPDKIINGLRIAIKALEAEKGIIAIEENKPDAIKLFSEKLKDEKNIQVAALKIKYPQGGEKQLIYACSGQELKEGALPSDIGFMVQNVASAAAISDAVNYQKPLIERVVTLSGVCAKNPGNYRVRLGTPIIDFINMTGGLKDDIPLKKVIMGGPMMGFAVSDLNAPILKGTNGIICCDETDTYEKMPSQCIHCGRCVEACPMRLVPQHLNALAEHQKWLEMKKEGLLSCIECGCCAYVCPAAIRLVQNFRFAKLKLRAELKKAAPPKKPSAQPPQAKEQAAPKANDTEKK